MEQEIKPNKRGRPRKSEQRPPKIQKEKQKRGRKPGHKATLRPIPVRLYDIPTVRLNTDEYIGKQLKPLRLQFDYRLREFSELSGIELTLISHFENHTGPMKSKGFGWSDTAIKYLKALGVKEVIFEVK